MKPKGRAYYNEYDKHAAAWLRQLIKQGLIADGEVDDRSILDVEAIDLKGFDQHHFFAGIGGWSYALRLSGWRDDRPVCTASLPCQPFSTAGKQLGKSDERHLLPHFIELVRQSGFNVIFGEQVEAAIRHGWLDDLHTAMEAENYTVGAAVLGAHSVHAPHIRQRLYWVADRINKGLQRGLRWRQAPKRVMVNRHPGRCCPDSRVGKPEYDGCITSEVATGHVQPGAKRRESWEDFPGEPSGTGQPCDGAVLPGCQGGHSHWSDPEWLYCRDEKYRPVEPGVAPLVDGISERMVRGGDNSLPVDADKTQEARVMRIRGYGNAIVPQTAAMFISAFMSI